MIKLLSEQYIPAFSDVCKNDAAGLRIFACYLSYGTKFPFCEFWVQIKNEKVCAAVSRLDGAVTVCGAPCNFEELAEFLSAVGFSDIFCMAGVAENLPFKRLSSGCVLSGGFGSEEDEQLLDYTAPLSDIYEILKTGGAADIQIGAFDSWYTDVSHRVRHSTALTAAFVSGGKPAACIMCSALTETSALIGGVTVLPEYRGRGIGKKLVSGMCYRLLKSGRRLWLCCREEKYAFYKALGFERSGFWEQLG